MQMLYAKGSSELQPGGNYNISTHLAGNAAYLNESFYGLLDD
jgi:hypothetical protein